MSIENKEMQENLESVWEVLQSLNRQPDVLIRQEIANYPCVEGSESKRSAS